MVLPRTPRGIPNRIEGRISRRGVLTTPEGVTAPVRFGRPYRGGGHLVLTPVRIDLGPASYAGILTDHKRPVRLKLVLPAGTKKENAARRRPTIAGTPEPR